MSGSKGCEVCNKKFGLFLKAGACSTCSKSVCVKCISSLAGEDLGWVKPQKVCLFCEKALTDKMERIRGNVSPRGDTRKTSAPETVANAVKGPSTEPVKPQSSTKEDKVVVSSSVILAPASKAPKEDAKTPVAIVQPKASEAKPASSNTNAASSSPAPAPASESSTSTHRKPAGPRRGTLTSKPVLGNANKDALDLDKVAELPAEVEAPKAQPVATGSVKDKMRAMGNVIPVGPLGGASPKLPTRQVEPSAEDGEEKPVERVKHVGPQVGINLTQLTTLRSGLKTVKARDAETVPAKTPAQEVKSDAHMITGQATQPAISLGQLSGARSSLKGSGKTAKEPIAEEQKGPESPRTLRERKLTSGPPMKQLPVPIESSVKTEEAAMAELPTSNATPTEKVSPKEDSESNSVEERVLVVPSPAAAASFVVNALLQPEVVAETDGGAILSLDNGPLVEGVHELSLEPKAEEDKDHDEEKRQEMEEQKKQEVLVESAVVESPGNALAGDGLSGDNVSTLERDTTVPSPALADLDSLIFYAQNVVYRAPEPVGQDQEEKQHGAGPISSSASESQQQCMEEPPLPDGEGFVEVVSADELASATKRTEEEDARLRKEAAERARVERVRRVVNENLLTSLSTAEQPKAEAKDNNDDGADGESSSFDSALGAQDDEAPETAVAAPLQAALKNRGGLLRVKGEPGRLMSRQSMFAVDAAQSSDEESSD